jgi:hypothetical protein
MTEETNATTSSEPVRDVLVPDTPGNALPVTDADLGAGRPIKQEEPKARPLQHAIVKACGHKLDIQHVPTQSNCEDCWRAYFSLRFDDAGVGQLHRMLVEDGRIGMERVLGKKFVRAFGRFLQQRLLTAEEPKQTIEGAQIDIRTERLEQ